MLRRAFRRAVFLTAMVSMLIGTNVPPASAALTSGACVISLNFNFAGTVGLVTAPSFDFVGGGTCAMTLAGPVTQSSGIDGFGGSILWNCAATVATGSWHQSFNSFESFGDFVLTGENGAWVFEIVGTGFVGSAQLSTLEAGKLATCATNPIGTLSMIGVMEFQDP